MSDAAWTSLDPAGEVLLEQARARRLQGLRGRERTVKWVSLASFVGFVLLLAAVVPAASPPSLLLTFGLVAAYALATKVEFEVASGSVVPTQLVLVPMLFLLPPALVPIAVAAGFLIGELPGFVRHRFHPERVAVVVLSSWHAVGAAAVFAVAGEQSATLSALPVLAAALFAQFAVEFATTCAREVLAVGVPIATLARAYRWVFVVDALLTPVGFLAAVASAALGSERSCSSRHCSCSSGSSRRIAPPGSTMPSSSRMPIAEQRSCWAKWSRRTTRTPAATVETSSRSCSLSATS